jgi:hypothetical protein
MFWVPMKEMRLSLKEQGSVGRELVKACFRTTVGDEFISKPFPINFAG